MLPTSAAPTPGLSPSPTRVLKPQLCSEGCRQTPLAPQPERRGCTLPGPSPRNTLMVTFWGASGQTDVNVFRGRKGSIGPFPPETSEMGKGQWVFSFLPPQDSSPCRPLPNTPSPQGPWRPGLALTGHVELDGLLRAHTSSGEGHLTGKVGAVVLGPQGEGEHGGLGSLGAPGGEGLPGPGEGGRCPPLTGPWHATGNVLGVARF